jgi:hypothetical protein
VDTVEDIVDYEPDRITSGTPNGAEEASRPGVIDMDGQLTYFLTPELLDGARTGVPQPAGCGIGREPGEGQP